MQSSKKTGAIHNEEESASIFLFAFRMHSQVVVITGSSQGIGKALARRFLHARYRVVINARDSDRLSQTAAELASLGDVSAVTADVASVADCRRLIDAAVTRFGRVDVLINNAGLSMQGELDGMHPTVFREVVGVNLIGAANVTTAALPHIKRSQGQILFISSLAGMLGLPGYSAYCASKMALTALAQSLRGELRGQGVNVAVAYLGFTENDKQKKIFNSHGEIIGQPDRQFVKAAPVDWVAERILLMVERRKRQAVIGPPGRIAAWANWLIPQLCQWYAGRVYRHQVVPAQQLGIRHAIGNEPGNDFHYVR